MTVTSTAARGAAPGSIYLDGAAKGEPFIDTKREVYNLDHHEGCVRAFTMATCEQAMVLLRKGLDFRKRDWTVYANDPDLDTVLAIWVLLNHLRLRESADLRARVMPLLRVQGAIDAQGLELQDLCGFPPALLAEMQAWIGRLREEEVAHKARRRWREVDLLEHTAAVLNAVDTLVYPPHQLAAVEEIDELARVEIANGSVAIVCRSAAGVYEVERALRRLHGRRLGVIALQTDAATYSLRQVDPYLPATLEDVYVHLNLVDPAAGGPRSSNRWGGSAEIGGSPRASGTRITPEKIATVCRQAFATPTLWQCAGRVGAAIARSASILLAALGWIFVLGAVAARIGVPGVPPSNPASDFAVVLAVFGGAFFLARGFRSRGLYGLRRPSGLDWWTLLPVALAGAFAGGVWIPAVPLPTAGWAWPVWHDLLALLMLPVAAEVIFRGVVHGSLVTAFPIHKRGARWLLSWPVFLSAALYALWGTVLWDPMVELAHMGPGLAPILVPHLGALVFGVAAGMARERSESVGAAIVFHWLSVAGVLVLNAVR